MDLLKVSDLDVMLRKSIFSILNFKATKEGEDIRTVIAETIPEINNMISDYYKGLGVNAEVDAKDLAEEYIQNYY